MTSIDNKADRLREFEELGYEPEQLKEIIRLYHIYKLEAHSVYGKSGSKDNKVEFDPEKDLLVFKSKALLHPDVMHKVRDNIWEQIKKGMIVMPNYMDVVVIPDRDKVKYELQLIYKEKETTNDQT